MKSIKNKIDETLRRIWHSELQIRNKSIMRPYATYRLQNIFEVSTVPNQAAWLKEFTVKMINLKISMTKRKLTLNILERLDKLRIGTNELEIFSRKYQIGGGRIIRGQEKERQRKQFVKREMNAKIRDAKEQLMKVTMKYKRYNGYFRREEVRRYGCDTKRVNEVMQDEVEYEWQRGVEKIRNKIQHLKRKWGATTNVPDKWRGISISDRALEEFKGNNEYGKKDREIPIYGETNITKEQEAVLTLPPGIHMER